MKNQKSFTLIELLVVIAIVGLLSSVVLVSTRGLRGQAKRTKALEFSRSVQHALGAFAVGWWSFETIESGNQVLDASGYDNNGTAQPGMAVEAGLEQMGNALRFDGSGDYVDIGDNTTNALMAFTSEDFSIEAWVKLDTLGANSFVSRGLSPSQLRGYWFYASGSYVYFKTFQNSWPGQTTYSYADITVDTWYHVVVSRVGASATIYINGADRTLVKESHIDPMAGAQSTKIGTYNAAGNWLDGLIDEVRVYERALTTGEIQQHYAEGLERHQNLAIK